MNQQLDLIPAPTLRRRPDHRAGRMRADMGIDRVTEATERNSPDWVNIPGWGYQVSANGEIRYADGRPKRTFTYPNGYVGVAFYRNNKPHHFLVHRLVGQAFLPNPENRPEINHKNGLRADNRAVNLEWATRSENMRHSTHVLGNLAPVMCGTDNPRHRPVYCIDPKTGARTFFKTMTEAAGQVFDIRGIYAVCSGEQKTHYGHVFEYAEPPVPRMNHAEAGTRAWRRKKARARPSSSNNAVRRMYVKGAKA